MNRFKLLLLLFACFTLASAARGGWEKHRVNGYYQRKLKYGDSYAEVSNSKSTILWSLNSSDVGVDTELEYFSGSNSDLQLRLLHKFSLVEFDDLNGNKILDENEAKLNNILFSTPEHAQSTTRLSGTQVLTTTLRLHPAPVISEIGEGRELRGEKAYVVTIEFTHTTDPISRDSSSLVTPNFMEAKVSVENYPWSSSSSFLALELAVKCEGETELFLRDDDDDEEPSKLDRLEVRSEVEESSIGIISWLSNNKNERLWSIDTVKIDEAIETRIHFTLGDASQAKLDWTGYIGVSADDNNNDEKSTAMVPRSEVIILCAILGVLFVSAWAVFIVKRRRHATYVPILGLRELRRNHHDIL